MNTDFVAFGHHPALLFGMEKCCHRGHIKRALDTVFFEQLEDSWYAYPIAELAPGQAPDRLAAVTQVAGLVITVE